MKLRNLLLAAAIFAIPVARAADAPYQTATLLNVQPDGPIPTEWKSGNQLDIRIQKHALFVKLSYDGEIETHIKGRHAAKNP